MLCQCTKRRPLSPKSPVKARWSVSLLGRRLSLAAIRFARTRHNSGNLMENFKVVHNRLRASPAPQRVRLFSAKERLVRRVREAREETRAKLKRPYASEGAASAVPVQEPKFGTDPSGVIVRSWRWTIDWSPNTKWIAPAVFGACKQTRF